MGTDLSLFGGRPARALKRWLKSQPHGWTCAWPPCGKPIDPDLHWNDDWAWSLDHIVPISRGGAAYSRENVVAMHRRCNAVKNDRMPGVVMPTSVARAQVVGCACPADPHQPNNPGCAAHQCAWHRDPPCGGGPHSQRWAP